MQLEEWNWSGQSLVVSNWLGLNRFAVADFHSPDLAHRPASQNQGSNLLDITQVVGVTSREIGGIMPLTNPLDG
jgi:hypothetical protein